MPGPKPKPIAERFWPKVEKHDADCPCCDGCWHWTASLNSGGYGQFGMPGRKVNALSHRLAYELLVGPIPEGLTLDHLCRVRHCVNPAHLEPVTLAENVMRGTSPFALNALKTRCLRGHLYDDANTITRPDGRRQCRKCKRAHARRAHARLNLERKQA